MRPLDLFRSGMDTMQIADHFGIHEGAVERIIHRQRCEEKGVEALSEQPVRRASA